MMLLAFPNRADECVLAGGDWLEDRPLELLQTRDYSDVARSTDLTEASTQFTYVFPRARKLQVNAIARHNFTVNAKYRVTWYSDEAMEDVLYASEILDVWPMVYTVETVEWEDDNFWSLTLTDEEREAFPKLLLHISPQRVGLVRAGKVEIFDTENPDGYIEAGRFFVADGWTPVFGMGLGHGIQYESNDEVDKAYAGNKFYLQLPKARVAHFTMPSLKPYEAIVTALDFQRVLGTSGECLFVSEQKDTAFKLRRSFIGVPRQLSAIEQPYKTEYSNAFEIEECL